MIYETPTLSLLCETGDSLMASVDLKDMFAIELWDMLVGQS